MSAIEDILNSVTHDGGCAASERVWNAVQHKDEDRTGRNIVLREVGRESPKTEPSSSPFKPCPWCGNDDAENWGVERQGNGTTAKMIYRVACHCGACGPWVHKNPVDAWNERIQEYV